MNPFALACSAAGIPNGPARRIARRDRGDGLARLQDDVAHPARGCEQMIEHTIAPGIDLQRIHEALNLRFLHCTLVRPAPAIRQG
jgi:hypothetical protein